MKKIFFYLTMICLILFSFTGCQALDDLKKELEIANTDAAAREYGLQLIDYINEKDSDGIRSMFCEYVIENGDLDEQIDGLYQYLGGKIVSYDRIVDVSSNYSARKGEYT